MPSTLALTRATMSHARRISGRGARTRRALCALAQHPDPVARCLARSLGRAVLGLWEPQELAWFERIEDIRARCAERAEATGDAKVETAARIGSKGERWARALYALVRAARPTRALELGTCIGISAAYQACALDGHARLATIEFDPRLAAIARSNLDHLGLHAVQLVEDDYRRAMPRILRDGPIGYFFKDGFHDGEATVAAFEEARPAMETGGIMVFDDIRWSPGMTRAWRRIQESQGIAFTVDLYGMGVVCVRPDARAATHFAVSLP